MEFDIAFAFVPLTGWSETISPRLALLVRVQSLSRLAVAMCQLGDYIAHPSLCSSLEPSTCCNKRCSTGCSSGTTLSTTASKMYRLEDRKEVRLDRHRISIQNDSRNGSRGTEHRSRITRERIPSRGGGGIHPQTPRTGMDRRRRNHASV